MPEITKKRSGEIQKAILQILKDEPEGVPVKKVIAGLEKKIPLTNFEKSYYENNPGVQRIDRMVRFMSIGPVKAGWILKDKGLWKITEDGLAALEKYQEPEELYNESYRLYRQWLKTHKGSSGVADIKPDLEELEATEKVFELEEAEETAWSQINEYLSKINPYDFQFLVAGLLKGMGYHIDFISPPGRDGGIDIIAYTDPLGVTKPRIKIQVKRRAEKIQVGDLRAFMALLGESDVGIFINTGGFTSDAANEARSSTTRRVTLVDQERLYDLWVEYYNRIPDEYRKYLPLKAVYFLNITT